MGWWAVKNTVPGKNPDDVVSGKNLVNGDDPMDEMAVMVEKIEKHLGYKIYQIPDGNRTIILSHAKTHWPAWAQHDAKLNKIIDVGWHKIEHHYIEAWGRKPLTLERQAIAAAYEFGNLQQITQGIKVKTGDGLNMAQIRKQMTCEHCKYFVPPRSKEATHGKCRHPNFIMAKTSKIINSLIYRDRDNDGDAYFKVGRKFGCVLFEPQERKKNNVLVEKK